MISPLDARVLDANTEALGKPVAELMNNAGAAVAKFLKDSYPDKKVVFVCGPGNNGGDGFAAALKMDPDRTTVALLKKPSKIHSDMSRERYSLLECPIVEYAPYILEDADVVVDCALGTGMEGELREPYRQFILDANASGKDVVSVDVPSGLGTDTVVKPVATVTFHDIKTGMDSGNCGRIVVMDIGIPEEASRIIGPGDMLRYPVPSRDSHKGGNGRLMVIAGGPYFGAPIMASMAALRTGADIVRVFTPESSQEAVSHHNPVLMVTGLPGDHLSPESVPMLLEESGKYNAVLIGPGLGTHDETVDAVRMFVTECRKPMIIDADGLTAIKDMHLEQPSVLTPHRREFESLGGGEPSELAATMGATVLLKGPADVITDGERTRVNRTGTPGMTGAGTGDVLAGTVAALVSKRMSPFDAASLGAYICGRAGEICFDRLSYGMIATDVIDEIPTVLRDGLRR